MNIPEYTVKNRQGFTFVELLIVLVVLGIVLAGVYTVYTSMHRTWISEDIKASMQQTARSGMDSMVREMMMMGYGSNTKILIARQTILKFEERIQKPDGNFENKRIRYYLDTTSHKLLRTDSLADDAAAESAARTVVENVKSLSFAYYYRDSIDTIADYADFDSDYFNEGSPGEQSNRDRIRRVTVTLTVQGAQKVGDDYPEITLKADLSPRNLWEGEASMDETPPLQVGWLKVRDTAECGTLKVQWERSTAADIAGYLIRYGTTPGTWTNYIDVPASPEDTGDPEAILTNIKINPYIVDASDLDFNGYYVTIQAYDRSYNFSTEVTPVGGEDPYPSITVFTGDDNDGANTIPKPDAPSGLAIYNSDPDGDHYDATCPENAVMLRWNPSSDPNVIGYRIYRSTSDITTFPVDATYLLAKEDEDGDGWAGARADVSAGSSGTSWSWDNGTCTFIDKDPANVGCKIYYYAVCAVTCDRTRIYGDADHITVNGGRYTYVQYATISGGSDENSPPPAPGIQAKAGWKRVFLQMNWPSASDYDRTEVYFRRGGLPAEMNLASFQLIKDHQITYPEGTFKNFGTAAANTIIFNKEDADIGDTAQPDLQNNTTYGFVAISYDKCGNTQLLSDAATTDAELCGDDPCGKPVWTTTPSMWVDGTTTNLDSSTWDPNDADGNTQIDIGFKWTDVDKTDMATAFDFAGYNVSSDISPTGPFTDGVAVGEWNNYLENKGLVEGQSYSYKVQATDCIWQNIGTGDVVYCPDDTAQTDPHDYYYIKDYNITPLADAPGLDNIRPGKFRKYSDETNAKENFTYTTGQFHNVVHFYLQNTSAANMKIQKLAFNWGNPSVKLGSIKFMASTDLFSGDFDPEFTYPANVTTRNYVNLDRLIHGKATSSSSYSGPFEVVLTFVNSDGTPDDTRTDMRYDVIQWEAIFENQSMYTSAVHDPVAGPFLGGFTTGLIIDTFDPDTGALIPANPRTFAVSGGPVVNTVVQSQPVNPTDAFRVSEGAIPAVPIRVPGASTVKVTASITKPDSENITEAALKYYVTDYAQTNVFGAISSILPMTQQGSDFTATIPVNEGKAIWYDVYAKTDIGNSIKRPLRNTDHFYYQQAQFDPCDYTPKPPTNLQYTKTPTNVVLTWTAPTQYTSNTGIKPSPYDAITYTVYKRTGGVTSTVASGLSTTTYTTAALPTALTVYWVTAKDSCTVTTQESTESNTVTVCAVGVPACSISLNPTSSTIQAPANSITANLQVLICDRAGDGRTWATRDDLADIAMTVYSLSRGAETYIKMYEVGDTGIFTMTGTSDTTIWIDRTADNYMYTYQTGDPLTGDPTTDVTKRTFGAGVLGTLPSSDTLRFTVGTPTETISGCVSITTQMTVTIAADPCTTTPKSTTIVHGARTNQGRDVSLTWNKVTQNTDNTALDPAETHRYRVYFMSTVSGSPLQNVYATVTDNGDGTVTWNSVGIIPANQKSDTFTFYVVTEDGCASPSPNVSAQSNTVTITPAGSF